MRPYQPADPTRSPLRVPPEQGARQTALRSAVAPAGAAARRAPTRRRVAAATAVLALAGCAGGGVADAAAPWSPPATVASGIDVFWHPTLGFTGDGHALATLDGSGAAPPGLTRVLAAPPGTTAFRETGRIVLIGRPA